MILAWLLTLAGLGGTLGLAVLTWRTGGEVAARRAALFRIEVIRTEARLL